MIGLWARVHHAWRPLWPLHKPVRDSRAGGRTAGWLRALHIYVTPSDRFCSSPLWALCAKLFLSRVPSPQFWSSRHENVAFIADNRHAKGQRSRHSECLWKLVRRGDAETNRRQRAGLGLRLRMMQLLATCWNSYYFESIYERCWAV